MFLHWVSECDFMPAWVTKRWHPCPIWSGWQWRRGEDKQRTKMTLEKVKTTERRIYRRVDYLFHFCLDFWNNHNPEEQCAKGDEWIFRNASELLVHVSCSFLQFTSTDSQQFPSSFSSTRSNHREHKVWNISCILKNIQYFRTQFCGIYPPCRCSTYWPNITTYHSFNVGLKFPLPPLSKIFSLWTGSWSSLMVSNQ